MADTEVSRRRRQADSTLNNNGFVTNCEARFVPLPSTDEFVLVWACPEGVASPSLEELDEICRVLFSMQLVESCSSPSGLFLSNLSNVAPLPSAK